MFISRVRRAVLSMILGSALMAVPGSMARASTGGLGTLMVLAGTVTLNGAAGPVSVVDGQTVQVGDEIWTGPDSFALITFFDGSEAQLQSDTHVTLEAPADGNGVSVFQSAGTTVNHVHHLAPNATFQTDTPTAVAMVRGTTYVVTATPASDLAPVTDAETTDPAGDFSDTSSTGDAPTLDMGTTPDTMSVDAMQADDQSDDQHAALVSAVPLFDPALSSVPSSCERGNPTGCATSVVLLADADGHVGHVEVASHIVGHPTLHLTAHGDAAHVSNAGAVRHAIPPEHLTQLHDAAQHLRDAQRARAANVVVRQIVHRHLGLHRSKPPAPAPTQHP